MCVRVGLRVRGCVRLGVSAVTANAFSSGCNRTRWGRQPERHRERKREEERWRAMLVPSW